MHKYVNFIFFTDEKLFTTARPSNSQNDRVYDGINKIKNVLIVVVCFERARPSPI